MGAGAPFPERLCGTFEDRMTEAGHAVEGLCGARSGLRRGLCDCIPLLTTLPFGHARRYALCGPGWPEAAYLGFWENMLRTKGWLTARP